MYVICGTYILYHNNNDANFGISNKCEYIFYHRLLLFRQLSMKFYESNVLFSCELIVQ